MKKKKIDWNEVEQEALNLARVLKIEVSCRGTEFVGRYKVKCCFMPNGRIEYGHPDEVLRVVRLLHELGHAWNEHGEKNRWIFSVVMKEENEAWDFVEAYLKELGYEIPAIVKLERKRCLGSHESVFTGCIPFLKDLVILQ